MIRARGSAGVPAGGAALAGGAPHPQITPVIPAKAGIQTVAIKLAIRNQAPRSASGSPLPLWERARVRVRRAQARRCGRDARAPSVHYQTHSQISPVIPAKAGIQTVAIKTDT